MSVAEEASVPAPPPSMFGDVPEFFDPTKLPTEESKTFYNWLKVNKLFLSKQQQKEMTEQGQEFRITHMFMDATISKLSVLSVPEARLSDFYAKYVEALKAGAKLYVVEKADRSKPVPLLLDYDVYFEAAESGDEIKLDEFKEELLRRTNKLVQNSIKNGRSMMYVQEAPVTSCSKGQKLGMHLLWPDFWVDESTVLTLRRYLIHGLARTLTTDVLRTRYNLRICEGWHCVVDKSVCTNVQIRLPGSRKLINQKCKCGISPEEKSKCQHRLVSFESLDSKTKKKQIVERWFFETARMYELRSVWNHDGSHNDFALDACRRNIQEMCLYTTIVKESKQASELTYDDPSVPDTEDDRTQARLNRKRHRSVGQRVVDDVIGDAAQARRMKEAMRSGDVELDSNGEMSMANKIRETFFSGIESFWCDLSPSIKLDSYNLKDGRYASVLVTDYWCGNLGGYHNNRGGTVWFDAKKGLFTRKCMCKHIEADYRYFGSCFDYKDTHQLLSGIMGNYSRPKRSRAGEE